MSFFQRSVKREHIIIKWILRITHMDKNSNIDFADWIQDGRVLSKYGGMPYSMVINPTLYTMYS